MSVFVAINNFELKSLSFTEQNIINKNQMNPLGVLFTLEESLYWTSLVYSSQWERPAGLPCIAVRAIQDRWTHKLPMMCHFYLHLKNEITEDELQK